MDRRYDEVIKAFSENIDDITNSINAHLDINPDINNNNNNNDVSTFNLNAKVTTRDIKCHRCHYCYYCNYCYHC